MITRCKFRCVEVSNVENGATVKFTAVTSGSPENEIFFKWTPSGNLFLSLVTVDNAALFVPGKDYYLDIAAAE